MKTRRNASDEMEHERRGMEGTRQAGRLERLCIGMGRGASAYTYGV
jgi:hypothetical protein